MCNSVLVGNAGAPLKEPPLSTNNTTTAELPTKVVKPHVLEKQLNDLVGPLNFRVEVSKTLSELLPNPLTYALLRCDTARTALNQSGSSTS